ncbi:hypothetical protein ACIQ4Z_04650 [Peribacillus asahii]|uniref:hypothetical protein n=1 Tax=Peribacillus asahii TaxID=228899 RepID=UPI0037F9CF22
MIDRLIRHYKKSYEERVKRSPRYIFFISHKEKMIVYYREVANIYERKAIEALLITVLKPKYNELLYKKLLV